MGKGYLLLVFLAATGLCDGAFAEAQNVKVGGAIVVLGEYYRDVEPPGDWLAWPAGALLKRPIGRAGGLSSPFGCHGDGPGASFFTQWTRVHVSTDFTEDVSAFIELDSVDVWGEDFRSDYISGADSRASSLDDVEVYQAYLNVENLFGQPLRLRIGRQELGLGSEWLVGPNTCGPAPAWGLSFDAIRLTYALDDVTIDGWWAKLQENSPAEEDGDVDFYGIYGSYQAFDNFAFDAYYLLVRDARSILCDTLNPPLGPFGGGALLGNARLWALNCIEDYLGWDDWEPTYLHTAGVRGAGDIGPLEIEAELAYQWGDADQIGSMFRSLTYGDNSAEFGEWALNLEVAHTFNTAWSPRVYVGYAFFGGQDNRDVSFLDWINPFHRPEASMSFNRLFSNWSYSPILDGSELSNVHIWRGGASINPTEKIEVALDVVYMQVDEPFDSPVHWQVGKRCVPLAPGLSFWTRENSKDLGWEACLSATYQYSEDLYFCAGWDHLFPGDGLECGNFNSSNGLDFTGGLGGDGADYFFFETGITF